MSFVSDMDMAALEFDVKAAQDVLNMFAEAGKTRIRVQDLLQQCMARIDNWQEKYEKLETLSQNHDTCNATEFAHWMGISRQAFYNWKQNGFIIFRGARIDMPGTYKFWTELKWLLRW